MSAYIRLMTPMIDEECLLQAVRDCGFSFQIAGEVDRVLLRPGYTVEFIRTATGYRAALRDDERTLLGSIVSAYHRAYSAKSIRLAEEARIAAEVEARRKAEAERIRMEEERRRLVESQRLVVHEKAKKMGYQIKETREGEVLRLVLVKRTY